MTDRNEPLELMDEIERDQHRYAALIPDGCVAVTRPEWQSFRTALEAQRDELAHIETELSAGQGDDDGAQILPDFREDSTTSQKVGECLHLLEVRRDVIEAQRKTLQIKDEELVHLRAGSARIWKKLAQKDARIARLGYFLGEAYVALCDFDGDEDFDALLFEITEALKENPRQSAAAIKGEAWGWKRLDQEPPPERDRWYLFGGWTDSGKWVFEKMHYSLSGLVNGWSVETAIHNGNTHWCDVVPPADRIEREAKEASDE